MKLSRRISRLTRMASCVIAVVAAIYIPRSLQAQSCQPYMLFVKSSEASASKCGFGEYTNANPPRVNKYLVETAHYVKSSLEVEVFEQTNAVTYYGPYRTVGPGVQTTYTKSDYDETRIGSYTIDSPCSGDNPLFPPQSSYSGSFLYTNYSSDTRPVAVGSTSNQTNNHSWWYYSGNLNNNGWQITSEGETCTAYEFTQTSPGSGWFCYDAPELNTTTNSPYIDENFGTETRTPTVLTYVADPPPIGGSEVTTYTLSSPITDQMLWGKIYANMPSYPTGWNGGTLQASSTINSNFITGSLKKALYQFAIPRSASNTVYLVKWDIVKTDPYNQATVEASLEEEITGTGDINVPAKGSEHGELDSPPQFWSGEITNETASVIRRIGNVTIQIREPVTSIAGSGPMGKDGGCTGCGDSSGRTAGLLRRGGVSAQFSLGNAFLGASAGSLRVWSPKPSASLASPVGIKYDTNRSDVVMVAFDGVLRQAMAPQALADVVTNNQFSYDIRFYYPADVGDTNSEGIYQLLGTPAPFVTWTIENPDASVLITNRLRITETRSTDVKQYDCVYHAVSNSWVVTLPGGLRSDEVVVTNDVATQDRIETYITRGSDGNVVAKSLRRYRGFSWGEGLVEETLSPDSDPKTTTYSYYDDSEMHVNGYYTPLKMTIHPDGEWEYIQYNSYGRKTAVYSGFGDYFPGGDIPNSAYCRLTQYSYYPVDSSDNGTLKADVPRTTTESLLGVEVSRSHMIISPFLEREYRCQTPGASWDAPDNLVTITTNYSSGDHINQPKSIVHPDGTMTFFTYEYNSAGDVLTNIVKTGQPNAGRNDIVDGSRSVTVIGAKGEMISASVTDIASSLLLSLETYSLYDALNRPTRVTHLDGTYEDTQFACCGVDTTTDRDGVVTFYKYDVSKRQTATVRNGITSTNVLDAAGRTVKSVRIGTDASQIVLAQSKYNLAGELTHQTNALNGVTSFMESMDGSGHKVRTTTNPDGGTRIETYYLDGSLLSVTGTAEYPVYYEYGVDTSEWPYRAYTKEIKGSPTGDEWTKTYTDLLGRSYKTIYSSASDTPVRIAYYNIKGQMTNQIDPDGVSTLYQYNTKGELAYTAVDVNRNGVIDFSGLDRISCSTNDVYNNGTTNVRRTRSYLWKTDNVNSSMLVSTMESATDGLRSWSTAWNNGQALTSRSQTVFGGSGYRYTTNIAPDNSYSVSVSRYGTNVSFTKFDALTNQITSVTFAYDTHGRQNRVTDVRNGTTTNWFNAADQVSSIRTPVPATGQNAQVTTNYFDTSLRVWKTTLPDNTSVTNEFFLTGMLRKTYGSRIYPVEYAYDYAGRMTTMKTWQNFANDSGVATTTWNYDVYRGWLTNKLYADSTGPKYTYTPGGRMETRTWARTVGGDPLVTTNFYNNAGDMSGVDYSDATPDVTYTYDRLGRQKTIAHNGTITTFTYNEAGLVLTESYSGGTLSGLSVTNGYDQYLRRTNLTTLNGSTVLARTSYGYDTASRLKTVADGANTAAYGYIANSPLVGNVWFTNNTTLRMTVTKSYDYLNRLTAIASAAGGSNVAVFNYANNAANQRTAITNVDSSRWAYQYDALGQVVSGKKYWSDGTPVVGQQFEYGFDDIGNRKSVAAGGDAAGANLRYASYTANSLNQYTSRDVPGFLNVIGSASNTATVTLWGDNGAFSATSRKGDYFRGELGVTNTANPVWLTITNLAVLNNGNNPDIVTNTIGKTFVAKAPEAFYYDLDGNLTNDGRWTYTWDAENRLVKQESLSGAPYASKYKLEFEYDSKGRRIQKLVSTNNGSSYVAQYTNRFVYDGWNLVAILNPQSSILQSFTWGLDLSGSEQGAGGVGGLLRCCAASTSTTNFVAYDGNGNVAALLKADGSALAAQYEYGPFGEVLRATGASAQINPFRFSTKYHDDESDQLYYGYRNYGISSGRWLNRDQIEESGGANVYCFVANVPSIYWDFLGWLKRGDELKVTYKGGNIGKIKIDEYYKFPGNGKSSLDDMIGAKLVAIPQLDDCEGSLFKWRQHVSEMQDDKYSNAPQKDDGKYRYLDKVYKEFKDFLDIDYSKPIDGEWYAANTEADENSSDNAYTFRDRPRQYMKVRMKYPDDPAGAIKKVTVSFKLELVKVKNHLQKSGGESLLTISWGYWYTKNENGLLNDTP